MNTTRTAPVKQGRSEQLVYDDLRRFCDARMADMASIVSRSQFLLVTTSSLYAAYFVLLRLEEQKGIFCLADFLSRVFVSNMYSGSVIVRLRKETKTYEQKTREPESKAPKTSASQKAARHTGQRSLSNTRPLMAQG